MQVDLRRRAHLLQHPVVHHRHSVGQAHRLDLVVGDIDAGGAVLDVQPLELRPHVLAQLGVERADRLVHQQRLRPPDQRPPDRHALQIAPRQRRGPPPEQRLDPERGRHVAHLARDRVPAVAGGAQRKGDVLEHRQVRIEREELEHEGDVARARRQVVHRPPVDGDRTLVDLLEPGDRAQRRRLAAARGPEQHHELPVCDLEVEPPDHVVGAEALLDVVEPDLRHHSGLEIVSLPEENKPSVSFAVPVMDRAACPTRTSQALPRTPTTNR